MTFVEIVLIAVGLSMDAFAVSLAAGAAPGGREPRAWFRLAFHFGLFQFMMPVIGWAFGRSLSRYIAAWDHWIAFVLLAVVGIRMIRSGLDDSPHAMRENPSRGWSLILLSIATSIDALAVGLTLAMLRVSAWYPSAVIGLVTFLLCFAGARLGGRLGAAVGRRMEIAGGIVLLVIGARIVFSHLHG